MPKKYILLLQLFNLDEWHELYMSADRDKVWDRMVRELEKFPNNNYKIQSVVTKK